MAERKNQVSNPPLMTPMVGNSGLPSRAWSVWFRDLFDRTANKQSNSIDDNAKNIEDAFDQIDGQLDTLEEVIIVVTDHELRIDDLEIDVLDLEGITSDHEDRIVNLETESGDNAQSVIDLETRVFGSTKPDDYDEAIGYAKGDYVVSTSPGSYYRAIEAIALPAGVFNPLLWQKISLIDNRTFAEETFVAAGYGGIGVNAVKAIGTINSTFQTVEGFDIDLIATANGVTYDKANHGLKLNSKGVWEFNIKITLEFDEENFGRKISVKSWNDTTSTGGTYSFDYFVGRNQAGVNIFVTIAVEVDGSIVSEGDLIQLQIGTDGDTFANANNIGTIYQVKHISELK